MRETSERLIGANLLAVFGVPVKKDVRMLNDGFKGLHLAMELCGSIMF